MIEVIKQKLKEIEKKENVKILLAVESGSRAWGFESPDSDYDVRFIYIRPLEHYLKLEKTSDVIEWQLDEVFDINGWDLRKALQLFYKGNLTLFEWNNSPIIYQISDFWKEIQTEVNYFFNIKSGVYHYLNSAMSNSYNLDQDNVILKKIFYSLRPILAGKWILDKKTPPPVLIDDLIESVLDEKLKTTVYTLITTKRQSVELEKCPKIEVINEYIEAGINELNNAVIDLNSDNMQEWDKLNEIFIKALEYKKS